MASFKDVWQNIFSRSASASIQNPPSNDVKVLQNQLELAQKDKSELARKLDETRKEVAQLNSKLRQTKTLVLNQSLSSNSLRFELDKTVDELDEQLESEKQLRSKLECELKEVHGGEQKKLTAYNDQIAELRGVILDLLSKSIEYETDANNDSKVLANLWNRKGVYLFYLKRDKEAIDAYNQAISLNPRVSTFFFNRADTHFHVKDYGKARKDVQKALELNSSDKDAISLLAEIENAVVESLNPKNLQIEHAIETTTKHALEIINLPVNGASEPRKMLKTKSLEIDVFSGSFLMSPRLAPICESKEDELLNKSTNSVCSEEALKLLGKVEHVLEDIKELMPETEEFAEELLSEIESLKIDDEEAKKLMSEIDLV